MDENDLFVSKRGKISYNFVQMNMAPFPGLSDVSFLVDISTFNK